MKAVWIPAIGLALVSTAFALRGAFAFDRMYEATRIGEIEVKELPARCALTAQGDGSYFQRDDGLFMTLFDYIKKNDVSMTTPVEAEIDTAAMRFFVGADRADDRLEDSSAVRVSTLPARTVVSVGIRGAYSKDNFLRGQQALEQWLTDNPEWSAVDVPYAVYWDGPYMPVPFRRSEVHLHIAPIAP